MNREKIMTALYAKLTAAPLIFDFTADITYGDVVVQNVSDMTGLWAGMPISGEGAAEDTTLATVTPNVTLSRPATRSAIGAKLHQGFRTKGRRLLGWEQVADQPAIFLIDGDEHHPSGQSQGPADIVLDAEVYLYSRAGEDPDAVPASVLNVMIDAIESAIGVGQHANPGLLQNLGLRGVRYCRIEGDLVKAGSNDGAQALAMIPIKIAVAKGIATV